MTDRKPAVRARRPSRASGRVTLADVAARAGVSPITVSRALRGARGVGAELVEGVRRAAQELGYTPDLAARALATQSGSHVAVLIPLLSNALFVDLLESVQSTLMAAGFQTLIGVTHYRPEEEEKLLESYLAHRPAGWLLTGFDRTEQAQRLVTDSGVPCVHMVETRRTPGVHSVGFSQRGAGQAITQHLVDRGRRRIAFVAAQLDPRVLQRAEGYRRCLRQRGLYDPELELLTPAPSSLAIGGRLFDEMLQRHPDVDAIFFCNDDLAQGALLAALRRGVDVPGRVAVAGFNDLTGSDQMLPPLTTVRTPRREIGENAARMLLQLMRREEVAPPHVDLGYELVVRGST